tara:strand:- start:2087 stop:3484 length:1398 start_codon:yes stop_codon:yes gene_type:complete
MSIRARRQSLLKSSISINSIRESVAAFNKGLQQAKKNAAEIVKNTKESNIFKRTLIGRDNTFFRKRQENIRRKDREDEIEAVSLSGAVKRRGTILAKSTRGFLGRMLDFVGILLIGWALINLPRIIKGLRGLINLIRKVTGILGSFINTIKDIVVGIGSIITDAISKFPTFDFEKNKRGIEENLDKASGGLFKLDQQLVQSGNDFTEFGDELDIQYEQELKDAENEGSVEGTPSTSDGVTNEQNEETIKGYKEQIAFNVDNITKDNRQQNEEEAKDPIDNIKPRKNSSENLDIDQSKLDPKKIIDDEINKIDVDGEEIAKKETDNQIKGKQTNDPETSPLIQAINNKRSPKLTDARNQLTNIKKNVVDEVSSLTNEYKTDFEGGEGGKRKINLSSLLAPTKKDVNVKSKKKKGDTIFIIEKKVSNDNMQPAMANTGRRRGLNNLGEFDNSNETLVKLQSTSLKYT